MFFNYKRNILFINLIKYYKNNYKIMAYNYLNLNLFAS